MSDASDKLLSRLRSIVDGDSNTQTGKKKHRSRFIFSSGLLVLLIMVVISVCVGPTGNYNPVTAISALVSALINGGDNLSGTELVVYHSRFPRTIAAIAVGIGLSIAGSMYQAIIRNPLVDPYIMGVSAGAGTAAIAVLAFNFTLFGLLPEHSVYLSAVCAILGGSIAFVCTMLLGELSGGSNNSYVLAGVVVGLLFSACQTVMIVFSGDAVNNALLWLFGSFSSVTYSQAIPVFILAICLSMISLKWAKEFNVILLGEDQAKQMGLNAHRFSMIMLTIASVLTSVCVAFVGIIGFVGLVVPHLCRMIFGGDHRLVMPASIIFGGTLMVAADIASRIILPGYELPVGAITTLVGVPVFAYLLFKRGKIYNG